ncbi:MAG: ATP-binding cassette domain-containing protein [Proteobacteria bacterium]|nr:ATP-binding cassette domain-containing protein [Pseudomonadota bacterium]
MSKGHKFSLREITKSFPKGNSSILILRNVSLFARHGEFISILGPSGCGKSTLFNVLAGLIKRDGGIISIDDRTVDSGLGEVAYMQQKDLLFPWRTLKRNILLGPEISGDYQEAAEREAEQLMVRVGLKDFEKNYPAELSVGMRQRAALVRTLLSHKDILLLDEPFGALDAMTRSVMQRLLLELWADYRKTVLLVTHDVEEALLLSDRIYILTARPASVKGQIAVNIPRPRKVIDSRFVHFKATLLDSLEGEIERAFA